jgi:ubiquinone biosynthesis protein
MERHIEEMVLQRPVKIVEEFTKTLEREIDYTIEATSMERIARQFMDVSHIYIPEVFRELTTEQIITMEYVAGIKVSEIERLDAAGLDRKLITSRGANICLKQIFTHGFFHADPHPGNIFVLPNNVICLIDFGMVGIVDQQTREDFVELIDAVVNRHESRAVKVLLKITLWENEPDARMLQKDVSEFIGEHLFKPLHEIVFSKVLNHLLELTARHRLGIPPDLFLMMKALGTVEGVALLLDPEFDMIAQTAPFIEEVKLERFRPEKIVSDLVRLGSDLFQFMHQFPGDLIEISRMIKQRKFLIQIEHTGLEKMRSTQDQTSNRISFSIIIAALLIGSALIIISAIPPLLYGISLIGIIGFLTATVMGLWLLVAILKKGKL